MTPSARLTTSYVLHPTSVQSYILYLSASVHLMTYWRHHLPASLHLTSYVLHMLASEQQHSVNITSYICRPQKILHLTSFRLTTSYVVCLTCVGLKHITSSSLRYILHLASLGLRTSYILYLSGSVHLTNYVSSLLVSNIHLLIWAQQHGVDLTSCQCRVDVLHLTSYILPMQTSYINILQWYWAPRISSASAVMELFHSVLLILHPLIT